MPLTLEDAEKLITAQDAKIKAVEDLLASTKFPNQESKAELEKKLEDLTKRFDELHENYAKLTATKTDEAHHCHWCL